MVFPCSSDPSCYSACDSAVLNGIFSYQSFSAMPPKRKQKGRAKGRKSGDFGTAVKPVSLPGGGVMSDRILLYRGVGLPDELFTNLVYSNTKTFTSSTIAYSQMQSSLYDPDPAIGGGQPSFFTALSVIYARWQVLKMRVEWCIALYSGPVPVSFAYTWDDNNPSGALSVAQLSEGRFAKFGGVATAGSPPAKGVAVMDMRRIHGDSNILQIENQWGTSGGGPIDSAFFTLAAATVDGAASSTWYVNLKCTYSARFFALINAY